MKVYALQRSFVAIASIAALLSPLSASARPNSADVAAASSAYSKAQVAELDGNHAVAADLYEAAHSFAPSPEALRAATRAREHAGHLGAAATHASRLLALYPTDEEAVAMATQLLKQLSPNLVQVDVQCDTPCLVGVDGSSVFDRPNNHHLFYISGGEHTLTAEFGEAGSVTRSIASEAGERESLSFEQPQPQPQVAVDPDPPREPAPVAEAVPHDPSPALQVVAPRNVGVVDDVSGSRPGGISRLWFAASASTALAVGGVALWSGLNVLTQDEAYERNPTKLAYDEGRMAERRTNILIGAASGLTAVSIGLAFMTDWRSASSRRSDTASLPSVNVSASKHGGVVELRGSF